MKLRNKKTGEIIDLTTKRLNINSGSKNYGFNSLAELNEEWEDYEEPKEYWWISPVDTEIEHCVEVVGDEMDKYNKEIGNYFKTKEEAEKAVEKLKAWKRLKGKGLKCFNNKIIGEYGNISYRLTYPITGAEEKDLNLLFNDK